MAFISFCTFGLIVVLSTTYTSAQPTVNAVRPFIVGQTKTLTCYIIVTGEVNPFPLSWSSNNIALPATRVESRIIQGNVWTYTTYYDLTVQVTDNNRQFFCSSTTPSGTTTGSITIYVDQGPNRPVITGPGTVVRGDTNSWVCVSDGSSGSSPPTVTWEFSNGTDLPSSAYSDVGTTYNQGGLELHNVTSTLTLTVNDIAPFTLRCQTNSFNLQQSSFEEFSVAVHYLPVVTGSSGNITRTEGTGVAFTCSITAEPDFTDVTWYKDGDPLDIAANSHISGGSVSSPNLLISSTQKSDTGVYFCSANNSIGSSNGSSIRLTVNYAPVVTYPFNPVSGVGGTDLTLTCQIEAVPAYTTVIWDRVDSTTGQPTTIQPDQNPSKYAGGTASTTPNLTIKNLANSDAGNYRCKADNNVGRGQGVLLLVDVNFKPELTVQSTVTATEPAPATLTCDVVAKPNISSLTWYKGEQEVDTSDRGRYSGGNVSEHDLTVLSVGPSDAGSYYCAASNAVGNTTSGPSHLTVLYFPVITLPETEVTGLARDTTTLNVTIETYPALISLKWRKRSDPSSQYVDIDETSSKYGGGTTSTPSLQITSLASTDTGSYIVVVTNSVGQRQSPPVNLTVIYSPILTTQPSLTASEPDNVTITCTVDASPAISTLIWYKGGQVLNTSDTGSYSGGDVSQPSLTVLSVGATDAGNYYCAASNAVGTSTSATTNLNVLYYPIITPSISEVAGNLGSSVTLDVTIETNPALTYLKWQKRNDSSGTYVDVDETSSTYAGGNTSDPSLQILSLASTDIGTYIVVANNSLGQRQSTPIIVNLNSPPTVITFPGKQDIYLENRPVTLTCSSDGFPTPQYQWYFNNQLVFNFPVLTIISAEISDIGVYRCVATNSLGSVNDTIFLNLLYRPRASAALANVTAIITQTVTLTCNVDANPSANSFSWTHNGVVVANSSNESQLTVTVTNNSALGRYECVASNSQGTSEPISIFINLDTGDDGNDGGGRTGQSTEGSGLSTATLILIIIICIILLVVIILLIIYCCSKGRCRKKDNGVVPAVEDQPPPAVAPVTKPEIKPVTAAFNGYSAAVPPIKPSPRRSRNGHGHANGRINLEEDANTAFPRPSSLHNGTASLGHGLSISVPGGETPRPHHLPPLGQDGVPEETESARDEKPKRRKRKRRDQSGSTPVSSPPDLNV